MLLDYAYCNSKDCIHKRGCKRNLCNYTDAEIKEIENNRARWILAADCINSKPYPYQALDRFRNSDEEGYISENQL